jgi:hypothetical protein
MHVELAVCGFRFGVKAFVSSGRQSLIVGTALVGFDNLLSAIRRRRTG